MPDKGINLPTEKIAKKELYIKQPRYYDKFRCVGGGCLRNCCENWRITWRQDEIDKVKAGGNAELTGIAEKCFVPDGKGNYSVALDKGRCPFLDEDKMCSIQRKLGAEYLSMTCSFYPRKVTVSGSRAERTCMTSCPEVLELVCESEDSMDIVIKKEKLLLTGIVYDSDEDFAAHPELRYRSMLSEFYYDLIGGCSRQGGIERAVIAGSFAADTFTDCIGSGMYDDLPMIAEEYKKRFKDPITVTTDMEKRDNYIGKLNVAVDMINSMGSLPAMSNLMVRDSEGVFDIERYIAAKRKFDDYCRSEKPWLMRNIALNMLLICGMPFFNKDMTLFENYCYYAASFAVTQVLGAIAAVPAEGGDIERLFKMQLSSLSRMMFQNKNEVNVILDILRKRNCLSMQGVAVMLMY